MKACIDVPYIFSAILLFFQFKIKQERVFTVHNKTSLLNHNVKCSWDFAPKLQLANSKFAFQEI